MGASYRFFKEHAPVKGKCPFAEIPDGNEHAVWLKPKLVCVVAFMEHTAQGGLRQPVCRGIRTDKSAKECIEK